MFEWLKKLFGRKEKKEPQEETDWDIFEDGDFLAANRRELNLNDMSGMEQYINECCRQMKEQTEIIERSNFEYNAVTERLRDIEEIEALPPSQAQKIKNCASKILEREEIRQEYLNRKDAMPKELYHRMERHEEDMPEAINKLRENEDYKSLVRKDLKNLEGEKISYRFARHELMNSQHNKRILVAVILVFEVLTLLALLVMQFQFKMEVSIGILLCIAVGAIFLTAVFTAFMRDKTELKKVEKKLNRAIVVQNRIKIRYVNVSGLIDYACAKYQVNSSDELKYMWERYLKEKARMERYKAADEELGAVGAELISLLADYRIKDPEIWVHQVRARTDHREMVEIRHELVAQRGSLRRRINYNEEKRNELKEEVKKQTLSHPDMAPMIMDIVEGYGQ